MTHSMKQGASEGPMLRSLPLRSKTDLECQPAKAPGDRLHRMPHRDRTARAARIVEGEGRRHFKRLTCRPMERWRLRGPEGFARGVLQELTRLVFADALCPIDSANRVERCICDLR